MRFPFFRSRRPQERVEIALPEMIPLAFVVYIAPEGPPPQVEDLPALVQDWLRQHATEPFDEMLCEWISRELVTFRVWDKDKVPAPPLGLLSHFGMTDDETQRYERSTHCITIFAPDMARPPRCGLWCALGAARALALAFGGVAIDTAFPRFLPVKSNDDHLADNGRIAIAKHISVPFSVDERGKGWMTTMGMSKFALPNLEVRDVPPDLSEGLLPIVNAIAQNLAERVMREALEEASRPKTLLLERELKVTLGQIARAFGQEESEPEDGVRGWTLVGLSYDRPRRGQERMIQVIPPPGFPGDQGVWLHSLLTDLIHVTDDVRGISKDSAAMDRAHGRAKAELPAIKTRFQQGLKPGELLHVKHGFPTGNGDHEFMWVAVNTWKLDRIVGQLANDPIHRLDLRAGETIEMRESDVFDWLLTSDSGHHEGGYTDLPLQEEGVEIERYPDK